MILGYCLNEWEHYRMKIPCGNNTVKNPHVLITEIRQRKIAIFFMVCFIIS